MTNMLTFRILVSTAEMLPFSNLIGQLGYEYNEQAYADLLESMIPLGYSQLAVFEKDECIAIAGFWISSKLYCGKYMELDNVVVDQRVRSRGIGKLICDKMEEIARKEKCKTVVLNAYVQNKRAHKFYFNQGYHILGFGFQKILHQ